ncbi:MAG: hypothetical protein NTX82_03070 [Candidatus Parcubacteria bacterium]|nr:hypothetical protein [Candidatus Parcubacteria bacterium]
MRIRIFVVMAVMSMLLAGSALAVEDKPQMGVFLNTSREVGSRVNLQASMVFINLMSTHAPYTSLGLSYQVTDQFNLAGSVGYGFEESDTMDTGWFLGIDTTLKSGDWVMANSFYYYAGFDMVFTAHSVSYPLGFTRVGVDARNYHYLQEVDEGSRSYQIGPSLKIPFNDKLSFKLNYYYAFEPYGEPAMDSNVYKATLIYNF